MSEFAFRDVHGHRVCAICIDGLLLKEGIPYQCRMDRESPNLDRVYTFPGKPPMEMLSAFEDYLAAPTCTRNRHAWFEQGKLESAHEEASGSLYRLLLEAKKPAGWSIGGPE